MELEVFMIKIMVKGDQEIMVLMMIMKAIAKVKAVTMM